MTSSRALLASALLIGTIAGCTEAPDIRGAAVRDSAGVTLIDHGPDELAAASEWTLSAAPLVRIGTVAGEEAYQFHQVQNVSRTGDGSIAVVDRSLTLRLFDGDGMFLWSAGGEGDGPGEFRFPNSVREIEGDSLVVWDRVASRLSVFTREGRLARTATLRGVTGYALAWGLTGPRELLVEVRHLERTRIDGHEALVHPSDFYLVDLDGTITRELGRRMFATNFQEVDENGAFSPAIFATSAVIGTSSHGLWYGDTKSYELREEEGPDGIRRIVRWQGPDRTVTDDDVEAVLAKWRDDFGDNPEARRFLLEYGNTHPRAERFPAYGKLHVDRTGRLWVQEFVRDHVDDGLRRWTIFSADGTSVLGRLVHAAAIELHDVGDDWLLGVERDELDVESVALYRIVRDG